MKFYKNFSILIVFVHFFRQFEKALFQHSKLCRLCNNTCFTKQKGRHISVPALGSKIGISLPYPSCALRSQTVQLR